MCKEIKIVVIFSFLIFVNSICFVFETKPEDSKSKVVCNDKINYYILSSYDGYKLIQPNRFSTNITNYVLSKNTFRNSYCTFSALKVEEIDTVFSQVFVLTANHCFETKSVYNQEKHRYTDKKMIYECLPLERNVEFDFIFLTCKSKFKKADIFELLPNYDLIYSSHEIYYNIQFVNQITRQITLSDVRWPSNIDWKNKDENICLDYVEQLNESFLSKFIQEEGQIMNTSPGKKNYL